MDMAGPLLWNGPILAPKTPKGNPKARRRRSPLGGGGPCRASAAGRGGAGTRTGPPLLQPRL
ncbi:hypothetical protein Tharo_0767 [Thauera aromatica K172]|uniref:Uncharacterized protein n=1 Tax=Thauera aromatica K172 TaxID=44139 RepID=A0A2R4BK72_THAAR|nr:hypothetical protein Tharo_0767 [Thauera aromatica K172]